MNKQIKIIAVILVLTIVPLLIYGFLQLKSLSEDEQIAGEIYEKQMETVLFSLNQLADDMISQWARKMNNSDRSFKESANDLILRNESIKMLYVQRATDKSDTVFYGEYIEPNKDVEQQIEEWFYQNDSTLNKLIEYFKAGFQKVQGVQSWHQYIKEGSPEAAITFVISDLDSAQYYVFIVLESRLWIEQILGVQMQVLASDELNAAVFNKNSKEIIHSVNNFDQLRPYTSAKLWILPDLQLAIQSTGESYQELVKERSRNNMLFLIFTLFVLTVGIIIIIRNIQNALRVAQLKSDFVSNVSHEIRTPLSLIKMYAETLMLNRLSNEERKAQYYKVIYQESGRLTHLVNNILDFSRIEANRKVYNFELIDFNKLVEKIHQSYEHTFTEKQVNCTLNLSPDSAKINADPHAIEEAISNLIENAIKYSIEVIEINMSTNIENGLISCLVKDNGMGIPKSEIDKIFDKFYRVENALTQSTKGTGMGLSLVKHIMDAHDGKVEVHSKTNVGSTFILSFPIVENNEQDTNS